MRRKNKIKKQIKFNKGRLETQGESGHLNTSESYQVLSWSLAVKQVG